MSRVIAILAALPAVASAAAAAQPPGPFADVEVVAPTPLRGPAIDPARLPYSVQTLDAGAFERAGSLSVTDALEQQVAGVSLSDAQGNSFTRDLNFRGFTSSPLQGTPQGLAVYLNGVRLNESFGDTVNWDLIPEVAIARASVFTSDPAFGMNALGGAVSLAMKTGVDAPGGEASVQGGSFGRVFGSAEYGAVNGPWSVYLAADGGRDAGWRLASPSTVARAYADIGWKGPSAEVHLLAMGGRNDFGVVGPTPVDLLNTDRRSIYTHPQTSLNRAGLVALNGRFDGPRAWSVQTSLYLRKFSQHHLDGNDGNFEGCSDDPADPLFGTLCVEDDGFPAALSPPPKDFQVLGPNGQPIDCPPPGQGAPCDGVPYGSLDRTRTDVLTLGVSVQATNAGRVWGHANLFAAGASLDRGRIRFSASSTLGVIFPDLSVGPAPAIPGAGQIISTAGGLAYSPVELSAHTTLAGIYATDTLDLTDRLSLTLSGRFNHVGVEMTDLTGASPALNGRHGFDRFNPSAGLAYRVSPALSLYGGYAETSRAPTPLELACSDPLRPCLLEGALVADPPLDQVVAHAWEAGLRARFAVSGGRIDGRMSLFQVDNDDDIIALASVVQGRGYFTNVPKTRRRGMEASLQYRSARWTAYASYSAIQASYRFAGALPSPNSPFADAQGDVTVRPGGRIGGVPSQRFKVGADVDLSHALSVGADVLAVGGQYLVGDEANQDARLPRWWTVSIHGAYRFDRRLELFGRIENLLDRRYATYGAYFETGALDNLGASPLPANPDPRTLTPAAPRSFVAGLRVRW